MGKIMLNGVTYSGTIYEASDIESGQGVEWLPATRVVYDDEITKLSANSAQTAIEKLKQLNDELSEKVPFSLAYNASTQEYGYINKQGKFIPFKQDDGPSKGGDSVKVFPEGNGTTPIAQIKVNDVYYTILGYGDSLVFKGHIAEDTLPEVNIKTKPTKNWIMISDEDKTYTYIVKNDYTEEEQELTLKTKKGDVVYSDGSNWSILFSTYPNEDEYSIIYLSEIEDGQIVGNLKVNEKEYPILVPSISGVRFEKVDSYADLPNPGVEGTIYLVLKESGEESNIYTEYIWVANGETGVYEMLGDTAVKAVDIEVSADYDDGKKIATITIDNEDNDIYIPLEAKELTLAEYNALPQEEKMKDVSYYIIDAPETSAYASQGVALSAQAAPENSNILRFAMNEKGEYGYYPPGADTLVPFKSGDDIDFSKLVYEQGSGPIIYQDRFLFSNSTIGIRPCDMKNITQDVFSYRRTITGINFSKYSTFRIICRFGTYNNATSYTHGQVLFGNGSRYWRSPSVELFNGSIGCGYTVGSSDAWTGWLSIGYNLKANNFYYTEFKWTSNSKVTLSLYDDEGKLLGTQSANIGGAFYNSDYFKIAGFSDGGHTMDQGPFIDLHNTFVEINNNEIIYGCNRDKVL